MKKSPLIIFLILALIFLASCGQQAVKGNESSISEMNDVTRCKIIADQVSVRTGCSNNTPVAQTINKDSKLDVISKLQIGMQ